MKRRELILELTKAGCRLKRHGSGHDIFENQARRKTAPVPRHNEIRPSLAELIKKQLGL